MSRPLGFTAREHAAAFAIFAAVTLAFFYPVLAGETFSDVDRRQRQTYPWAGLVSDDDDRPVHYDQADSFHPWQVFTSRQLRHGEFPHWDPYSFAGHPFYANGQSGVLYPPRLALSFAVSPARVHDLLLVSHFFAAGVAMFLLLGVVRLGFAASLVAALAWMTNSFALAWQALEHYVAIAVWLPLALLLAHVVVRRASWLAALALTLVLGLLVAGGQVLFVELALVAVAGYALALALGRALTERSSLAGNAARLATVFGLVAALTAVVTIPVLLLAEKSARVSLSYDELGQFALAWDDLVNVLRVPPLWAGDPYHVNLFAGTATALLAAVGAFARHPLARFAVVLGALTTLFMLHTPITWVVAHVLPGFDSFKPLARAAFLLQLALAILAAFGMQTTLRFLRSPRALAVIGSDLVLGVVAGTIVGGLVMRFGSGPLGSGSTALVFGLALVLAICVIVVFDVRARGKRSVNALLGIVSPRSLSRASLVGAAFVVIAAGSIVAQARSLAPHVMTRQPSDSEHLYPATPLTRFLEANGGKRVLAAYATFRGSTSMIFGVESAGGYESLLPGRVQNFWRVVGDGLSPPELASNPLIFAFHPDYRLENVRPTLLARAGVGLVVAPPGEIGEPLPPGLTLRYDGPDGRGFAVDGALPRAQVVGACEVVEGAEEALERFVAPDFDPSGSVILERQSGDAPNGCADGAPGAAGTAREVDRSLNSVAFDVRARRAGWLVVNESWDEDWNATIDGRDANVLLGNSVFRAVRVPVGTHVVRFDYVPAAFRVTAVISGAALLLIVVALGLLTIRSTRRRARPD